ncbi:MAG: RNA polymerase sigma factor [Saprospiraceae bacterium]
MLKIFRKKTSNYSDAELVARYQKSGDMELLGVLYERYTELIYGVCLKVLKQEAEAEDAFMNIFEKLTKKVREHDIKQFRPWLHIVVRNHCLGILRKQGKHLTVSYDGDFMQSTEVLHPFMEEVTNGKLSALTDCLDSLKGEQKSCVQLFYFEGKSYQDITKEKDLSIGKVRSYIQNGRRNLKICIERAEEALKRE